MYISDFLYLKTNRMMLFCNLFMERPSYYIVLYILPSSVVCSHPKLELCESRKKTLRE